MKLIRRSALILWLMSTGVVFAQALLSPGRGDESRAFNDAIRLERLGQLEEAESVYLELLDRNPKNTRAYLQLRSLYHRQKRIEDLEALIRNRLTLFPNDLQSQVELGELFFERGDSIEALNQWQGLINGYPSSQAAYRLVMLMLVKYQMEDDLNTLIERGRGTFNDPSLFSLELAGVYAQRQNFKNAAEEYVTYVVHHPDRMGAVSSNLLRMSDQPESQEIIETILLNRMAENETAVRTLYTHFLFKVGRYADAFREHTTLGFDSEKDVQRWLEFANNLRKESQLDLSLESFRAVLKGIPLHPESPRAGHYRRVTGEALYGLALTYEEQIIPPKEYHSLAEYFPDNIFFEDLFHGLPAIHVKPLEETFALYDSILSTLPSATLSPQAHFRLGEIKYRITGDFDGARDSYLSVLSLSPPGELIDRSLSRIADVLMARGDFEGAIEFLNSELGGRTSPGTETALQLKKCQALFLAGEIDSALTHLVSLMGELDDSSPYLNDVLELKAFIDRNYSRTPPGRDQDAFRLYVEGERLLKQAKLTEARQILREVAARYPNKPITHSAVFRGGKISMLFGEWDTALEEFLGLQDTPLGDQAMVVVGEIYQYHLRDTQKASEAYFTILEDYPESMLAEPVRYRIRALSSGAEG